MHTFGPNAPADQIKFVMRKKKTADSLEWQRVKKSKKTVSHHCPLFGSHQEEEDANIRIKRYFNECVKNGAWVFSSSMPQSLGLFNTSVCTCVCTYVDAYIIIKERGLVAVVRGESRRGCVFP